MSQIELLMQELNLSPDTIRTTLSRIEEVCQHFHNTDKVCFTLLEGNGDGNGNN